MKLFDPTAPPVPREVRLAPRPAHLRGLRIGLVENTKFNSDTNLSSYAWIPASFTADAAVGWGAINKNFTISLIVKNLFDNRTPIARSWNSYTPQFQRTAGIQLTGKL